jgi:threonine dehydratase
MTRYEPVESPDATTLFPYHDVTPPTVREVYAARSVVDRHLPRTPLVRSDPLSAELDADVYLKREDTLPTGAFKVRGGLNLVSDLDDEFREPGLIAASTGNHGQSIAYAGNEFDVPVVIAVPEDANPDKVAAMERLGARVEHRGADFDAAREWAEEQAAAEGYRYVHSANEPALVAGIGTAGLEVVEDLPDVDYLFCPVGGGSSAAAYCLTVGDLADASVVGVQSEAAPAMYRAWAEETLDPHDRMETFAEGLATGVPFALTTRVLREKLAGFLQVSDDALRDGVATMLAEEHVAVEGAAAASLAGARAMADRIAGSTVVLQVSGRNVDLAKLRGILDSQGY